MDSKAKGISIFLRILIVFMAVNIATSGILIVLAYAFSLRTLEKRTKESIAQQVAVIRDNFERQYGENLRRTLRALTASSVLDDYLMASVAEQLILKKKIERLFLRTIDDFKSYDSISFVNEDGDIAIHTVGKMRQRVEVNLKDLAEASKISTPFLRVAKKLFQRLESTPLLLSSGYMEWFMPPRDEQIVGPFVDERGGLALLAAISKLDLDTGTFGGVVMIRQNLDDFFPYLRSVKFFDANPIWVFDANGQLLQQPDNLETTFAPRGVFAGDVSRQHADSRHPRGTRGATGLCHVARHGISPPCGQRAIVAFAHGYCRCRAIFFARPGGLARHRFCCCPVGLGISLQALCRAGGRGLSAR